MRKRLFFLAVVLSLVLSFGSACFANEDNFESGIGVLSLEEQILDWFHNVAPTQGIEKYDGPKIINSEEDILSFEEVYKALGMETKVVPENRRNSMLKAFSGARRSVYEEAQDNSLSQTRVSTTKPTINPPAPITSRLVDAIGWYPDTRSLGLGRALDDNGQFIGYVLMIGVREIDGGPAQARRFELRHFDLLDGSRFNVGYWYTTNEYIEKTSGSEYGSSFVTYWFNTGYLWNPWLMENVFISYEVWWGKPWDSGQPIESIYAGGTINVPNIYAPQDWGHLFQ